MNRFEAVGHVVSASMVLAASHAMAHVSAESLRVHSVEAADVDADTRSRIVAAVSKKDFKKGLAELIPLIANGFGENGTSLKDMVQLAGVPGNYDHVGQTEPDPQNGQAPPADTSCYSNCYSNCYSACHGSRGWR